MIPKDCTCTGFCLQLPNSICKGLEPKAEPKEKELSYPIQEKIAKLRNTRGYENIHSALSGIPKKSRLIYEIVNEAEKMDKELDILHDLITSLYNIDAASVEIRAALDKIKKL